MKDVHADSLRTYCVSNDRVPGSFADTPVNVRRFASPHLARLMLLVLLLLLLLLFGVATTNSGSLAAHRLHNCESRKWRFLTRASTNSNQSEADLSTCQNPPAAPEAPGRAPVAAATDVVSLAIPPLVVAGGLLLVEPSAG